MAEIFFLFSRSDPYLPEIAVDFGASLVINKRYKINQSLEVITDSSMLISSSGMRFYVLPDKSLADDLTLNEGVRSSGEKFQYIMDRVGAAALDLTMYKTPEQGEVCVGSLSFNKRVYPTEGESLQSSNILFYQMFKRIRRFIHQSTNSISNAKTPRVVFAFPDAFALLRRDFSLSPWPSLIIL